QFCAGDRAILHALQVVIDGHREFTELNMLRLAPAGIPDGARQARAMVEKLDACAVGGRGQATQYAGATPNCQVQQASPATRWNDLSRTTELCRNFLADSALSRKISGERLEFDTGDVTKIVFQPDPVRPVMSKTPVRWLIGLIVVAAFGVMLWLATRQPPLTVQGEVSADRVDISPRVAARIITLKANVGDTVEKGAVLAELESPQLL